MLKTPFWLRVVITVIVLVIGSIYVTSPTELQIFFLIGFIISSLAYVIVYLRRFVRKLQFRFKRKNNSKTVLASLDSKLQKIFQEFKNQIDKDIKIEFSINVLDFESKWRNKTIYVNPEYVKKADKREIKSSLFHELGHIKKSTNYISDALFFTMPPTFYSMIFVSIDAIRDGIPIISIITSFVFIRLMMIIVSWRNEYRADKFASEYVDQEEMEIMFNSMPYKLDLESHPSPSRRRSKLIK